MKLGVKLFARAKDLAGSGYVQLDVPESADVAKLRSALAEQFPQISSIAPSLLVAVGAEYADDSTPIDPTLEIACFPPVSGG